MEEKVTVELTPEEVAYVMWRRANPSKYGKPMSPSEKVFSAAFYAVLGACVFLAAYGLGKLVESF